MGPIVHHFRAVALASVGRMILFPERRVTMWGYALCRGYLAFDRRICSPDRAPGTDRRIRMPRHLLIHSRGWLFLTQAFTATRSPILVHGGPGA